MGLNLLISFALATLGIKLMKVAFELFSKMPLEMNSENKPITFPLTILQQCWKKVILKPFGAFSLPRLLVAAQTSSSGNSFRRSQASSSEIES